jgi:hypothetical protein
MTDSQFAATITLLCCSLFLTACGDDDLNKVTADQCLRVELFKSCMAALPQGPKSTVYNDWDEVVNACENAAYYQSQRPKKSIKEGCHI